MENKESLGFKEKKEIRTSKELAESLGFTRLFSEKTSSSSLTYFKKIGDDSYEKLSFYDVGFTGGGSRTERVVLGVLMGDVNEKGEEIGWNKEHDLLSLKNMGKLDKYRSELDGKLLQEFDKNELKRDGYKEIGNVIKELEDNDWFKKERDVIKEEYEFGRGLMDHIASKFEEEFPSFIYDDKVREKNTSDIFFLKPPKEGDKKTPVLRFYRWGSKLFVTYKKAAFLGDVNDPKNIRVDFIDYVTSHSEDTVWYPIKTFDEEYSKLSKSLDTNDPKDKQMLKSTMKMANFVAGMYSWEKHDLKILKRVFDEEGLDRIKKYLLNKKIIKRKEVNK